MQFFIALEYNMLVVDDLFRILNFYVLQIGILIPMILGVIIVFKYSDEVFEAIGANKWISIPVMLLLSIGVFVAAQGYAWGAYETLMKCGDPIRTA